jgi:hypothetical protein
LRDRRAGEDTAEQDDGRSQFQQQAHVGGSLVMDGDGGTAAVGRGRLHRRQPRRYRHRRRSVNPCARRLVVHPGMVERRSNLSIRMGNRRLTRLTNAFSKKMENHMHAMSFYFMVYNFVKIHSSIKTTPAMEAGVTDILWSMEDIVLMAETNA